MHGLADFANLTLIMMFVFYYVLATVQTMYVFALQMRGKQRPSAPEIFYEWALAFHLLIMGSYCIAFSLAAGEPVMDFLDQGVPFSALLWINAPIAIACAASCVRGEHISLIPELFLIALCMPTAFPLLPAAVVADVVWFSFRISLAVIGGRLSRRTVLRRISMADILDKLPEGVLYIRDDGRAIYMNDTMRSCLVALGLPTDLADARTIWPALNRVASVAPGGGLRIEIPGAGETRYFTHERVELNGKPCDCIIGRDITELDRLRLSIETANQELEETGIALKAQLNDIGSIADNEAMLHMRSRVHDIIGQRLSILHRYLEDDQLSDESVEQIGPLLTSMVDELARGASSSGEEATGQAMLDYIMEAFGVIGVEYEVSGELPDDQQLAQVFAHIIREASTNAVRHGQATRISIRIGVDGEQTTLEVANNGNTPAGPLAEGSGIKGMRTRIARYGGTLSIFTAPRFTIRITVVRRGSERHDPGDYR